MASRKKGARRPVGLRSRPRTALSAFPTRRAAPKAERRAAAARARRGRLPAPGTKAARQLRERFTPPGEEAAFLKRAARDFQLSDLAGRHGPNPYLAELRELQERTYRAAYNAQQRERRAAKPAKPKPRKTRIRVRAHWRRVPR